MIAFKKPGIPNAFAPLLVFGLALVAITWRFLPWMPRVFYGDDLDYLLLFEDGRCATTAAEILTTTCYDRFRPFASSIGIGLMNIADHDITYHLVVNVLLQGLIGMMVYVISQRLSGGRWLVSLALALAAALSRLATYQVTQMIGPVESLMLLAILVSVYAALRADARVTDAWRWGWIAIAAAFVAIHTHERSIVVAAWLAIVFGLSPSVRALPRTRWLTLLAGCFALPMFYVGYKTFVLDTHFLVGTGGTHIELQTPLVLEHFMQAAKSLLGFNTGPEYLVGRNVTVEWQYGWRLALIFAASWIGIIVWGAGRAFISRGSETASRWLRLRWLLLLLILAAFLLAPTLITVRLEQRWLLAPFVIGLLVPAWASGTVRDQSRSKITMLAVILAIASLTVDSAVMLHYDRLFFVSSPRYAEVVKREIADPNLGQQGDIALLASADQCDWTLSEGGFFRIYGGKHRTVHCFATLDEAKRANLPTGTRIYGPYGDKPLKDLTDMRLPPSQAARDQARMDFIEHFAEGRISDKVRVQTPTGQGALLLPIDAADGMRQTLIILSGFVYRYENVAIEPGDQLRFGVGMIYPAPQSARAIIRVEALGQPAEILYTKDLKQPSVGAKPSFLDMSMSLDRYAGKRVTFAFSVESPGGDLTAHWIGFADPSIGNASN